MPQAVESALRKVAAKHASWGKKRQDAFVYGTMTNMQKRGEIAPWRKFKGVAAKHTTRKR